MVQGKLKTKLNVPSKKDKNKHKNKKPLKLKKGARYIAPKKTKKLEVAKLKKDIEKKIGVRIENDMAALASSQENTSLSIVSGASSSGDNKKKKQAR